MWYNCFIIDLVAESCYRGLGAGRKANMKLLDKLKKIIYALVLSLLKEETYEEDFRRNFSLKYTSSVNPRRGILS